MDKEEEMNRKERKAADQAEYEASLERAKMALEEQHQQKGSLASLWFVSPIGAVVAATAEAAGVKFPGRRPS